ncbi:MAG: hypothetical protein GX288_09700 [Clostridiales bacterium]|nr:hypothetical protein [Clostridiales bacterium]
MSGINQLINYPVPSGADLNHYFEVKVRPVGSEEWSHIPCYTVKVDMHDVRKASVAYFDFIGSVEVEVKTGVMEIFQVDIRPLSRKIQAKIEKKTFRFRLDQPENLSIEINKDRFRNLHLFAGKPQDEEKIKNGDNVHIIKGSISRPSIINVKDLVRELSFMADGRTLYFEAGIYYFEECCMEVPSNTNIYLAGGAIIKGGFICEEVQNIKIYGRGIVYQACFERFMALRGVRISYGESISIEGITFINPPHYTIFLGQSKDITIRNVKTFSCEGWSDGFDMMSCENIHIDNCFLRTSDDCIAVYGRRWRYNGPSRNILVENTILWADVAHPTMIGTHGDYQNDGNIIENIVFRNIDILEHHEIQAEYLGCLTINAGDKNFIKNITNENIRIEEIEHGKIFDFQVKCNPDYNPAPGKGIENVLVRNLSYFGKEALPSCIKGYSEDRMVKNIHFENLSIGGKLVESPDIKEIVIGEHTENISFSII